MIAISDSKDSISWAFYLKLHYDYSLILICQKYCQKRETVKTRKYKLFLEWYSISSSFFLP